MEARQQLNELRQETEEQWKIREEKHASALAVLREEAAKYRAIAEPKKQRFLKSGASTAEVDPGRRMGTYGIRGQAMDTQVL